MLRDNGLCVVVSEDPAKVKFLDPIPAISQRTKVEQAAVELSRILLNGQWGHYDSANHIGRSTFAQIYIDLLMKGTALDKHGSQEEQEEQLKKQARWDELSKLAREEARAERAAKKAAEGKK